MVCNSAAINSHISPNSTPNSLNSTALQINTSTKTGQYTRAHSPKPHQSVDTKPETISICLHHWAWNNIDLSQVGLREKSRIFFGRFPRKKSSKNAPQRTNYHPTDKLFWMGNHQFSPSEVEIRLENGKNTANTLGAFFWSFFLDFTSFFPGGLRNTQ